MNAETAVAANVETTTAAVAATMKNLQKRMLSHLAFTFVVIWVF